MWKCFLLFIENMARAVWPSTVLCRLDQHLLLVVKILIMGSTGVNNNHLLTFKTKELTFNLYIILYTHGWEHKISKSRQTQATGGKNCEKAGKLPRLCGDTIQ